MKIYELSYPFFYVEFQNREADKLTKINSLARITGFLNAAYRVKLMQSLTPVWHSVAYLDSQFLLLRNASFSSQHSFTLTQQKYNLSELGKWLLLKDSNTAQSQEQIQKALGLFTNRLKYQFSSDLRSQLAEEFRLFSKAERFVEWKCNQSELVKNPRLFSQFCESAPETLQRLCRDQKNVIEVDGESPEEGSSIVLGADTLKDLLEKSEFIEKLVQSSEVTQYALEKLTDAVKLFETQFAQGQDTP